MITACMASLGSSSRLGALIARDWNRKSMNPSGVKMSIHTTETAMEGVKVGIKKITRNQRCPRLRLEIHTASTSESAILSTRYSTVKNSVLPTTAKKVGSSVNNRT